MANALTAAVDSREPACYFPVQVPPVMPGPFHPVAVGSEGGSTFLELDRDRARYLAAKRQVLADPGRAPVRGHDAAAARAIDAATRWLRATMRAEHPEVFAGAPLAQEDLDALMLRLQEDIVVLARVAGAGDERAPAIYLDVCLPSHWQPERMLGKNFIGLHARVPYEGGFEKAARAPLARTLFDRPCARFVWTLTPDPALDQHPQRTPAIRWPAARTAYLRVERQVIVPLRSDSDPAGGEPDLSIFLIRVYVYPLSQLTAGQRERLRDAVSAMSEPMRRYKGLAGHEAAVFELLA